MSSMVDIHDTVEKNGPGCPGQGGFTLVELLVALSVAGLVMYAVYSIYTAQQRVYNAQLAVTEMQQNMRAAVNLLSHEIRMAGYYDRDKYGTGEDIARILEATPEVFAFTADFNDNGKVNDPGENILFDQYISGNGVPVLGRSTTGARAGHQPAVDFVEHVRFSYLNQDNEPTTDIAKIHTVLVDLVVRASRLDPFFINTATYTAADGTVLGGAAKNDHFRRRHELVWIECRNAGRTGL